MKKHSSRIVSIVAISVVVFLVCPATQSIAEVVPVNLNLSPPLDPPNVLAATLTLSGQGMSLADTDNTTLIGNVMANLTAQFSSISHQVIDISGIEFTGGTILFSDMSFVFNAGPMGTAKLDLTGVSGYLDTLAPPGVVSGGSFSTSDHVLKLNNGVGTSDQGGNTVTMVDFSVTPVAIVLNGTGSISASLDSIAGDQAIYNVALTAPMDYDVILLEESVIEAKLSFAGSGTLEAEGQFARTIPEPATIALLSLGGLALMRIRRR